MLAQLQNRLGGLPDLLLRDGLLLDSKRNRLARNAYLARLEFYLDDRFQRDLRFFDGLPDAAPVHQIEARRAFGAGEEVLFKYPSAYEAVNPAMRDEVAAFKQNRDGYLFLWRHDANLPRPLVLCVHGFQMGEPKRAMNLFKIEKLFRSGLDVALFMLPHHWRRAEYPNNPFRQNFINPHNVPLTIEAFGQTVSDLRSSYRLLESFGYQKIGLIGASLGGYASALYAAFDAAPECVFVAVPSLRLDGTLTPRNFKLGFPVDDALLRTTRQALQVVAPVNYKPRVSVNDIAVVYHAGDRIADVDYTREWIDGWRIPNVTILNGGHWAVFDGKARGRAWYAWLRRYGFVSNESARSNV